jgi:hypothetical protein
MANLTKIEVTACDNELYLIAIESRGGDGNGNHGSFELGHVKYGGGDPVELTITPHSVLPPGHYNLALVGINWGGPSGFTVKLTPGTTQTAPATNTIGAVWNPPVIPFTVQ